MEVYDIITVNQDIVPGNQIMVTDPETGGQDPLEVTKVIDSGDAIWISGYSHLTGDIANYILPPDTEVGLWTA